MTFHRNLSAFFASARDIFVMLGILIHFRNCIQLCSQNSSAHIFFNDLQYITNNSLFTASGILMKFLLKSDFISQA